MSHLNQILASKLVYYRKQHHLTQEELAEKLDVTFQAVSKWETARSAPDIALLPVLADLFGCSIDELFGRPLPSSVITHKLPWNDDDVYHATLFKGHKLIENGEALNMFTFVIDAGTIENLVVHGNVSVEGNVNGNVAPGNNASIGGKVIGDVAACGNIAIGGTVTGDCAAGGNIAIDGHVTAESLAAGSVRIGGNVTLKSEAHVGILECDSISGGTVVIHEQ